MKFPVNILLASFEASETSAEEVKLEIYLPPKISTPDKQQEIIGGKCPGMTPDGKNEVCYRPLKGIAVKINQKVTFESWFATESPYTMFTKFATRANKSSKTYASSKFYYYCVQNNKHTNSPNELSEDASKLSRVAKWSQSFSILNSQLYPHRIQIKNGKKEHFFFVNSQHEKIREAIKANPQYLCLQTETGNLFLVSFTCKMNLDADNTIDVPPEVPEFRRLLRV